MPPPSYGSSGRRTRPSPSNSALRPRPPERRGDMDKGRGRGVQRRGVIAIIITIMVLELKAPVGEHLADLRPVIPAFAGYVLSFIYVGIYWNNHHHMMHLVRARRRAGAVGQPRSAVLAVHRATRSSPTGPGTHPAGHGRRRPLYGFVLLDERPGLGGAAARPAARGGDRESALAKAVRAGLKETISPLIYVAGIAGAFVYTAFAYAHCVDRSPPCGSSRTAGSSASSGCARPEPASSLSLRTRRLKRGPCRR